MNKYRFLRFFLGFCFISLAVLIATYESLFFELPGEKIVKSAVDKVTVMSTCDPQIKEKIKSQHPIHIRAGDTLSHVLKCANILPTQVNAVIGALRSNFNPRNLKPEHELMITTSPSEKKGWKNLLNLTIRPTFEEEVIVAQQEDGSYKSKKKMRKIKTERRAVEGKIHSSLYMDAANLGVPGKILHEMIRVLSYEVDFQRSVKAGDGFEIMYDVQVDEDSGVTVAGELLYACLKYNGSPLLIYRFQHKNGDVNYYNEKGESIKKAILRTPVDGARISSGFGRRKHPILGFTRMHKGVDFAVPRGTPIMAAGDGVVEKAGWVGGYGKYIRIRHTVGNFKTAYAHLSRYAKGIRVGKRVKQGEIIGYSGSTGLAKGPHLHYEVHKNNRHINPRSLKKFPGVFRLKGSELKTFKKGKTKMNKIYLALMSPIQKGKTQLAGNISTPNRT